ncbi:MAG: DUF2239 family protein [Myxococcales bacterium]|nr:DUF2239 family protein [Myxococcales bacterium]MCB9734676.1 DUF2239 family protein [Deltaproteobacteria bacterium]
MEPSKTYAAFIGHELVASGGLQGTLLAAKERVDAGESAPILFFDDATGRQLDFDLSGTPVEVLARLAAHPAVAPAAAPAPQKKGPGRPKLGVVSREVSLLPRHWEWLGAQPGGASASLRRLVDQARRSGTVTERQRAAREAASRVMWALAGDLPGFEEASRALFASDDGRFAAIIAAWPEALREHLARMLARGEVQLES